MPVRDELLEFINSLEIVDTHEHLPNEAEWAAGNHDLLTEWLMHYFPCDLVSAGLSPADRGILEDSSRPLAERWHIAEGCWNAARNTAYARALDIAARDLYGLPRVDGETLEELDLRFRKRREDTRTGKKSHYDYVLKEKSRIAVSITDRLSRREAPSERRYFRDAFRLEGIIDINNVDGLEALGAQAGTRIHTLDDYKEAVETAIAKAYSQNAVALKAPFAYSRPIRFEKATTAAAEEGFNALFDRPCGPDVGTDRSTPLRALEDHMMHHVLRYADQRGLTVQVHTGLQEGNGNILANSSPELLVNLFLEYRNVTFDVFHMSYPYQNVLSALAKNFRNVMIDMCWAHLISPEASVRALVEFLDAVPANKISAFGGDFLFPDGVYGHQYLARHNVAKALAIKVEDGVFDVDRSKEIAQWMFVDNPRRVFKLHA